MERCSLNLYLCNPYAGTEAEPGGDQEYVGPNAAGAEVAATVAVDFVATPFGGGGAQVTAPDGTGEIPEKL